MTGQEEQGLRISLTGGQAFVHPPAQRAVRSCPVRPANLPTLYTQPRPTNSSAPTPISRRLAIQLRQTTSSTKRRPSDTSLPGLAQYLRLQLRTPSPPSALPPGCVLQPRASLPQPWPRPQTPSPPTRSPPSRSPPSKRARRPSARTTSLKTFPSTVRLRFCSRLISIPVRVANHPLRNRRLARRPNRGRQRQRPQAPMGRKLGRRRHERRFLRAAKVGSSSPPSPLLPLPGCRQVPH